MRDGFNSQPRKTCMGNPTQVHVFFKCLSIDVVKVSILVDLDFLCISLSSPSYLVTRIKGYMGAEHSLSSLIASFLATIPRNALS